MFINSKPIEFDKWKIEVIKGDIFMILDSELSFMLNIVIVNVGWEFYPRFWTVDNPLNKCVETLNWLNKYIHDFGQWIYYWIKRICFREVILWNEVNYFKDVLKCIRNRNPRFQHLLLK